MMLPPPCFTVGMVLDGDELCSVSFRHNALHSDQKVQFWSHQTTESFASCSESLPRAFSNHQVCCHVPFSQEWLPSGHSPTKPRFVKRCRLLSFRQFLPSQLRNSVVLSVFIGFLVTSLTKVLLAQLLSLVGRPALGRVWVVPYSFHFLMMGLTERE